MSQVIPTIWQDKNSDSLILRGGNWNLEREKIACSKSYCLWPKEIKLWSVLTPKPDPVLFHTTCVESWAGISWPGMLSRYVTNCVTLRRWPAFCGLIISLLSLHQRAQSTHPTLIVIMTLTQSQWCINNAGCLTAWCMPIHHMDTEYAFVNVTSERVTSTDINYITAGHPWYRFSGTRNSWEARRKLEFHPSSGVPLGEIKIVLGGFSRCVWNCLFCADGNNFCWTMLWF